MGFYQNLVVNSTNSNELYHSSGLSDIPLNTVSLPIGNPTGVVMNGSNPIVAGAAGSHIYTLSGISNVLLGSFYASGASTFEFVGGLSTSGGDLISVLDDYIHHHSGVSEVILGSFASTQNSAYGVHFHKQTGEILGTTNTRDYIYRYDGFTGTSLGSIQTTYGNTNDLAADTEGNLLVNGSNGNFIYHHSGISNVLLGSFINPGEQLNSLGGIGLNAILKEGVIPSDQSNVLSQVKVSGLEFESPLSAKVSSSMNDYNSSSNFTLKYDSPFGRHSNNFIVGEEVTIDADNAMERTFESNLDVNSNISVRGGNWSSQSFTIGTTGDNIDFLLDKVSVYINNLLIVGSPGDLNISIREANPDGSPKEEDIATGTITEAEILAISGEEKEVTLRTANNKRLLLEKDLMYVFIANAPAGDASNQYRLRWSRNTNSYAGGTRYFSTNSGSTWSISTNNDLTFQIKGAPIYPTTRLITGVLERVKFDGRETAESVTLMGRDYSLRLQDATVEPIVYTDSEISTIVTDIINNNVSDITTNNVEVTDITLERIAFNHTRVFDALTQLAQLAGFYFYIDNDRDLHFEKRENVSSGITLDNTIVNNSTLNQTREGMANSVFVYGDRMLAGFEETATGDGIGSEFTLVSKPRNTFVTVNGSPLVGGVLELTTIPTSGPEYLVSFEDRKVVFVSGTDLGYSSIPGNGSSIVFQYDRDLPIVKAGTDRDSIKLYGKKTKVINDKSIKDPRTATSILRSELENASPFKGVEVGLKGWKIVTPGTTAKVTLPNFNIDEDVGILNTTYKLDKRSVQDQKVLKIRLDKKITDITDEIKDVKRRLNAIEEGDRQESDQLTSIEFAQNDFSVIGSYWEVKTSTTTGSQYHLYSTGFTPPVNPFHLASGTDQGAVAGSYTGSAQAFGNFVTLQSGGFF